MLQNESCIEKWGCNASRTVRAEANHALCCRRWGYFPLLSQLRAVSAKPKVQPQKQQQVLKDVGAAAEQPDAMTLAADDCADIPDSPKANWMQLVKQKKQEKEDSIAHMIRVRHAVLVIQVSKACLQPTICKQQWSLAGTCIGQPAGQQNGAVAAWDHANVKYTSSIHV